MGKATHGKKQGGAVVIAGPEKVEGGLEVPPVALETREEKLSRQSMRWSMVLKAEFRLSG